jgi:hypothetical protein
MNGKNLEEITSADARCVKTLASKFDHNLTAYATAACAACGGLFALAQPSQAEIVYTPANITIPVNGGLLPLDINNDGIADFNFSNVYFLEGRAPAGTFLYYLAVGPAQPQNRVGAITSKGHLCAAAVPVHAKVGENRQFESRPAPLKMNFASGTGYVRSFYGPWLGKTQTAYLAFKFSIVGEVHYGWARVKVLAGNPVNATVLGYAYETIANKPIETGKTSGFDETSYLRQERPATLGALALGSSALEAWRK